MLIRLLVDLEEFGRGPDSPRPGLLRAGKIVAADHKIAPLLVAQGRAEFIRAETVPEPYRLGTERLLDVGRGG